MIAPELFALLFLFFGMGMLCGALVHAGLDERGPREEPSYSPSWLECHGYKKALKKKPLEEHAREGRELTAVIEAVDTIINLQGGNLHGTTNDSQHP
jgi:hypothetical protein